MTRIGPMHTLGDPDEFGEAPPIVADVQAVQSGPLGVSLFTQLLPQRRRNRVPAEAAPDGVAGGPGHGT